MSEEKDNPEEPSTGAAEQVPLCGERLAAARHERQISLLEVAKELHLDEAKVRALESNDFDTLGAPVFAKGHLRKYAQLVGVAHDDVLTDYYRLTRSQEIPPVVAQSRRQRREPSPGPWIAVIAVIIVVAIAYWFVVRYPLMQGGTSSQTPAATETRVEAVEEDQVAAEEDTVDQAASADPEAAVVEQLPEAVAEGITETEAVEETAAQPIAGAEGDVRLSVTFLGDCWTEISDASGRRLFFDLGREGQTIDVSGQRPLSVLFGDADNVALQVDGDDFRIADADRRGRTASLMIHGS